MQVIDNAARLQDAEQYVTQEELADLLGVGQPRIHQLAKELNIQPKTRAGGYPLKQFIRAHAEWMRARMKARSKTSTAQRKQLEDRLLAVKVQNAELDFQERVGSVTVVSDVESSALHEGKRVRETFMRLGSRIASELASESDPHAIRMRIDEEVTAALQDLSREDDEEPDED